MNGLVAVVIFLVTLVVVFKVFNKAFWALLALLLVELILITIWPTILVGMADFVVKIRELIGASV